MKSIALLAPAKINWTLEVLGKRDDGYHEIRSILQTINLCDTISLQHAAKITLSVRGGTRSFRRHADEAPDTNLAYGAARLLRERTGQRNGVEIRLHKNIPIAAGLGGGSSDAAAVLRGLRTLWEIDISDAALTQIASELGSDVPFFLRGGTALASGLGDVIEPLPDIQQPDIAVTTRRSRRAPDKTARMYAALAPEHYSDGSRTEALAARIRAGKPVRERDVYNAFAGILPYAAPAIASAMRAAREADAGVPHLCGSGPALFFFADEFHPERASAEVYHNAFVPVRALSSREATIMTIDG